MLAIQHLAHRYPKAAGAALSDVSLQAQRGEVLETEVEHGDHARELHHERHLVLDQENRHAATVDLRDQRFELESLLRVHSG